jgi:hypothetical protein
MFVSLTNGTKWAWKKVALKKRCNTPPAKVPINEIIRALVCHET